jgi:hypothetical protein
VDNATLAVDRADTFEPVLVEGLPAPSGAARTEPFVAALTADGAEEISIPLDHDGESWFFPAPVHPVSFDGPGTFEVRIRSGSQESAPHALIVDALAPAPGAFAAMVAKMRELLELVATQSGTSLAALKSTSAAEIAPELLPLKVAQSYLDSDVDPHDLTDLVANEDGFLDAAEVDLLNRSFGYVDLERYLQLQIEALQTLEETSSLPMSFSAVGRRSCIDVRPDISTAPELAMAMTRSRVAEIGADPNSEAGRILDAGGTYLTGVGFIPGLGGIAAIAGVSLSAARAAMGANAGIYPTRFTKFEATVSPVSFNEDSTDHATWDDVWVTANSDGWSADAFIVTSIISLVGGYLSDVDKARLLDNELLRDISAVGLGTGAAEVFDETGVIEFCANEWRVDISSPLYCTAAALDHNFDVDVEAQTATPAAVGADILRVAAQATQFGGRSIHADFIVEVRPIEVVVTPAEVVVRNPGQDIQITAEIRNADLTTLRWIPEQGAWNDDLGGTDTNGGTTRPLTTPTSTNAYPFNVSVESLTRNGLRESGEPRIDGIARVVLEDPEIVISPDWAFVAPGDTQQFTADVTGIEDPGPYELEWNVVFGPGIIDQQGLYTAPFENLVTATISAHLVAQPEIIAFADIEVSEDICYYSIEVSGDASFAEEGSQVAYTLEESQDTYIFQLWTQLDGDNFETAHVTIADDASAPVPRPGSAGKFSASFSFDQGTERWFSSRGGDAGEVYLYLQEFSETHMVGRIVGIAVGRDAEGQVDPSKAIEVDMRFRAPYWVEPDNWPCDGAGPF